MNWIRARRLYSTATKHTRAIVPGKTNYLVTSALPYVNNIPHLGNIVGSVLSADVYSRFLRQRGHNVLFVCGTDEYGTATETKAIEEGLTPRQICDKYNQIHKEIYDWFGIKFDIFGRTSTPKQTEIAQHIYRKCKENGYLLEDRMDQLYCEPCTKFLADRYVKGTCPHCGFEDAKGDQCDGCGKLLNAIELKDPKCTCKNSTCKPVVKATEHMFLDLPKLKAKLLPWFEKASKEGNWSDTAITVTSAWIRDGLKPRCITRDLKWGTPVPTTSADDAKYANKVFYVWFDAPIGYMSITANEMPNNWEQWWRNPEDVKLVQFMGKDNIPFHTIMFPSSLLATEEKFTLANHINTTHYLNYEGGLKFSKSRGTGVFGNDAMTTGINPEVWRYYLLSNRPESGDSVFVWDEMITKNNNELLANLGNLVNRTISFLSNNFAKTIPQPGEMNEKDKEYTEQVNTLIQEYIASLSQAKIKDGLRIVMQISKLGNHYVQENKPWDLFKTDRERCDTVLYWSCNLIKTLASLIEPYMPTITESILRQLNLIDAQTSDKSVPAITTIHDTLVFDLKPGHVIGEPQTLFKKISLKDIEGFKKQFAGQNQPQEQPAQQQQQQQQPAQEKNAKKQQQQSKQPDNIFPLDLRIARIESVEDHPNADQLYLLQIDVGDEFSPDNNNNRRTIVAGLKKFYTREELLNKHLVVLCNLKPSNIKGIKSQGMILAASDESDTHVGVLTTTSPTPVGTRVWPRGVPLPTQDTQQQQQQQQKQKQQSQQQQQQQLQNRLKNIDYKEFAKLDLKSVINASSEQQCGHAFFQDFQLYTDSGEPIIVEKLKENAKIY